MPVAVTELPARSDPPRKRWSRAEYDALSSSGLLESEHLELIEGELINKMGKKRPHTNSLVYLHGWLIGVFGVPRVNPETPIDVAPEDNPTNEPQPDLIVLNRDTCHFKENPRPADVLLVVEVSHSTLGFDLTTKAALYARAGIVEYWVLDVADRRMFVHRNPESGRYESVVAYSAAEGVAPLAAPDSAFRVRDAFTD